MNKNSIVLYYNIYYVSVYPKLFLNQFAQGFFLYNLLKALFITICSLLYIRTTLISPRFLILPVYRGTNYFYGRQHQSNENYNFSVTFHN